MKTGLGLLGNRLATKQPDNEPASKLDDSRTFEDLTPEEQFKVRGNSFREQIVFRCMPETRKALKLHAINHGTTVQDLLMRQVNDILNAGVRTKRPWY
jgi:hypothetical protein